jgi:hypothetical protein
MAIADFGEISGRKTMFHLPSRALGYFSDLVVSGQNRTAIGVRQEVELGRITGPNPEGRLAKYRMEGTAKEIADWLKKN